MVLGLLGAGSLDGRGGGAVHGAGIDDAGGGTGSASSEFVEPPGRVSVPPSVVRLGSGFVGVARPALDRTHVQR